MAWYWWLLIVVGSIATGGFLAVVFAYAWVGRHFAKGLDRMFGGG